MRNVELVKPVVQMLGKKPLFCLQKAYVWRCLKVATFKERKRNKLKNLHSLHKALPGYICCFLVWLAFFVGNDTSESAD